MLDKTVWIVCWPNWIFSIISMCCMHKRTRPSHMKTNTLWLFWRSHHPKTCHSLSFHSWVRWVKPLAIDKLFPPYSGTIFSAEPQGKIQSLRCVWPLQQVKKHHNLWACLEITMFLANWKGQTWYNTYWVWQKPYFYIYIIIKRSLQIMWVRPSQLSTPATLYMIHIALY